MCECEEGEDYFIVHFLNVHRETDKAILLEFKMTRYDRKEVTSVLVKHWIPFSLIKIKNKKIYVNEYDAWILDRIRENIKEKIGTFVIIDFELKYIRDEFFE